jgi:hypothetical protein
VTVLGPIMSKVLKVSDKIGGLPQALAFKRYRSRTIPSHAT